jgi:uncharacterized protein YktB (UPF0637 family)
MSLFFLYNPKFYDPGSVFDAIHPDALKKKKLQREEVHTEELKEEFQKLIEVKPKAEAARRSILETPQGSEERLDLIRQYLDIVNQEAQIARALIEMEEEELALILLLLEK